MSDQAYDVIVVGGGTSGMNAALAAARSGASTALIERFGHPGGTAFELGNSVSFHNNRKEPIVGGIAQEIVDRMVVAGGAMQGGHLPNPESAAPSRRSNRTS
jgi:flavin-dependent dehydrogenase